MLLKEQGHKVDLLRVLCDSINEYVYTFKDTRVLNVYYSIYFVLLIGVSIKKKGKFSRVFENTWKQVLKLL